MRTIVFSFLLSLACVGTVWPQCGRLVKNPVTGKMDCIGTASACPTCVVTTGSYSNPAWIPSLAGSKISGAVPSATALGAAPTTCPAGSYPLGVDASGNAVSCTTVPPPPTPGYTPNTLLAGGGVNWIGGLSFDVAAATYIIGNTQYTSPLATLTLGAADATNPRIDLIVVNTSGAAAVEAGTPAATPSAPVADPTTELALTTIYVPANSSTPGNITSVLVYDEDAGPASEWTTTSSGTGWALASTNNPYHGTKDIEATSVAANAYVNFAKGSTLTVNNYNYLVAYIRSKASWPTTKSLQFQLYLSGNKTGNAVSVYSGSLGFSSSSTTSYQLISIPVGLFGASVTTADTVRVTVAGSGSSIGFYLDYVQFQGGTVAQAGNYMTYRGTWNSTAAYNTNDTVVNAGVPYVALAASANSAPTSTNTNWSALSAAPLHVISFTIDGGGSAITTGDIKVYPTVDFACTIKRIDVSADQSGSITVDVWKAAGAIPAAGNKISASAPLTLSSAQLAQSGALTGWTTAVSVGDVFGFNVASATTVTRVVGQVWCQ